MHELVNLSRECIHLMSDLHVRSLECVKQSASKPYIHAANSLREESKRVITDLFKLLNEWNERSG